MKQMAVYASEDVVKWITHPFPVRPQTCTPTMKISVVIQHETRTTLKIHLYHSLPYPEKSVHLTAKSLTQLCSLMLYSESSETGNTTCLLMNEWKRKWVHFTWWNITQLLKKCNHENKNHSEWDNTDPKRQIWYVLIYIWVLTVSSLVSKLQSIQVRYKRTGEMIGSSYEGGTDRHRGWCRTGTDNQTGKGKKEDKERNIKRNS